MISSKKRGKLSAHTSKDAIKSFDSNTCVPNDTPIAQFNNDGVWLQICQTDLITEGTVYPHKISIGEESLPIVITRYEGEAYAFYDECPHRRIPLSERGYVKDGMIICGWHRWGFHLNNGSHMIPTGNCIEVFGVKEENEWIWVDIQSVSKLVAALSAQISTEL